MPVRKRSRASVDVPPDIEVRNPAGSVTVEAVEGATELEVRVEALDAAAAQSLDRVEIDLAETGPDQLGRPVRLRVRAPARHLFGTPRFAVSVRTPAGAAVHAAVASASAELRGRFGRVGVTSASGDAEVERCAQLQLRSASGDARIGTVDGPATIGTASGDLRLTSAGGPVEVRTASGDVEIGTAAGNVSARTASGEVTVGQVAAGSVRLTTVSGDVTVGVAPGLRVWLDLASVSGRMASELADDDSSGAGPAELTVAARTVSGNVRIRRTAPAG